MINKIVSEYVEYLEKSIFTNIAEVNIDLYETEYAENYSLANASIVYAFKIKNGGYEYLCKYDLLIKRAVQLLQSRKQTPFCRLFILHYSLISLLMLPDRIRTSKFEDEIHKMLSYVDDYEVQNTNGCAMKMSLEVIKSIFTKDMSPDAGIYLSMINPLKSGFINDSCSPIETKDGMPIAYHNFTLSLLSTALFYGQKEKKIDNNTYRSIVKLLIDGVQWWDKTLAVDGSVALSGRSAYQVFTWGVNILLGVIAGYSGENLKKIISYWKEYKKQNGSYSCTPNYIDHNLRVGYEIYTHVNMYNNLAVSLICIAGDMLQEGFTLKDYFEKDTSKHFLDMESGYSFFKTNQRFFACALRNHYQSRNGIASGFHFRHSDYFVPIAESGSDLSNSHFEGIEYMTDEGQVYRISDQENNLEIALEEKGYRFIIDSVQYRIEKALLFSDNSITWSYRCKFAVSVKKLTHYVPILLNDGRDSMLFYRPTPNSINMAMKECTYQLICDQSVESNVELKRYFSSPSGICTNAMMKIQCENNTVEFETTLVMHKGNEDLLFKLLDPYPRILELDMILTLEANSLKAMAVYQLNHSDDIEFAWYVYRNSERIDIVWYNNSPELIYPIVSCGDYHVVLFAKTSINVKSYSKSNIITL